MSYSSGAAAHRLDPQAARPLPQAVESLDDIARFLKSHLSPGMPMSGLPPAPSPCRR